MSDFFENLDEQMAMLDEDPLEEEKNNFKINGEVLCERAKLVYEKNRILLHFTHLNKNNMDFLKFDRFRAMISSLSDSVDDMTIDCETLKQVIVHIQLELGMNIFLSSVLLDMTKNDIQSMMCYEKDDTITFDKLCKYYRQRYLSGGTYYKGR